MGLKTEVRLDFAGERRSFNLSPIACLRRLQDACDAGPQYVLNRLFDGSWRMDDLRETIVQGLVGGGEDQRAAQALVEKWLDPEPKQQFLPIAQAVLMAWLTGAEDEDLGETEGEAGPSIPSPVESSDSPASMEAEPS
jgi:hypothetical protein